MNPLRPTCRPPACPVSGRRLVMALSMALLAACGGGSTGVTPQPPQPPQPPVGPVTNTAPEYTGPTTVSAVAGTAQTWTLADYVRDPDGDAFKISVSGTLPAGWSLSSDGRSLSFDGSSTGSGSVTLTINDGRGAQASATVQFSVSVPVQAGRWEALSIAPYSRVVPVPEYPQSLDSADHEATDAAVAKTVNYVPYRGFSRATLSDEGVLYLHGGLHSNYAGNEWDRCDLAGVSGTTLTCRQLDRPHIPKKGDVGYSTSGTNTLYKDWGTPLASQDDWQPYTYHNYTLNAWSPRHRGLLMTRNYPQSWSGGYPVSDGSRGTLLYTAEGTRKYSVLATGAVDHISDYAPTLDGFIGIKSDGHSLKVYEFGQDDRWSTAPVRTLTRECYQGTSGNGILIKHLYDRKFLIYNPTKDQRSWRDLFIYDHRSGAVTELPVPANWTTEDLWEGNLSFAVDTAGRRVFLVRLTGGKAVELYVAGMAALGPAMSWTPVKAEGAPTLPAWFTAGYDREPLHYWNNQLFMVLPAGPATGPARFWRVALGPQAPAVRFEKRPMAAVWGDRKVSILSGKHANWALGPDGYLYHHGGDGDGHSYNQQMLRIKVADWSVEQIQDTCGGSGPRPLQPDDGGWFWDAGWPGGGRFIWAKGGGGLTQSAIDGENRCPDSPSTSPYDEAATRWKAFDWMSFDPVTRQWSPLDIGNWPTNLHRLSAKVSLGSESSTRSAAFDPATRRLYRISKLFHNVLIVADMANRTVDTYALHVSADRVFRPADTRDGIDSGYFAAWEHQAMWVNPENGYLYFVAPRNGQLVRVRTRDPVWTGTDAEKLDFMPFDVLPNRLPEYPGLYAPTTQGNTSWLVPYQGGLLYWWGNPQGLDGYPWGMWWRSLASDDAPWIPVNFAREFRANAITQLPIAANTFFAAGGDMTNGEPVNHNAWVIRP